MVQTITSTLSSIDSLLTSEEYRNRRQEILVECGRAIKMVTEAGDKALAERAFIKKCKLFVRSVLPHLQELKTMLADDTPHDINNFLHAVTVEIPQGAQAVRCVCVFVFACVCVCVCV